MLLFSSFFRLCRLFDLFESFEGILSIFLLKLVHILSRRIHAASGALILPWSDHFRVFVGLRSWLINLGLDDLDFGSDGLLIAGRNILLRNNQPGVAVSLFRSWLILGRISPRYWSILSLSRLLEVIPRWLRPPIALSDIIGSLDGLLHDSGLFGFIRLIEFDRWSLLFDLRWTVCRLLW